MNTYIQNLNRIEFLITLACTGRCKHCSEGDHTTSGKCIDSNAAVQVIYKLCNEYNIESLMTFGGEPLLHPDEVCRIHTAAREMNIPERSLITNGFFSKDEEKIKSVAMKLGQSGVNGILLLVDAFHQETIPLKPVKDFAKAVQNAGISIRTNPAWLVNKEAENPYNQQTYEILKEFESMVLMPPREMIFSPEEMHSNTSATISTRVKSTSVHILKTQKIYTQSAFILMAASLAITYINLKLWILLKTIRREINQN